MKTCSRRFLPQLCAAVALIGMSLVSPAAVRAEEVACESLSISLDNPDFHPSCFAGAQSGGDISVSAEAIVASGTWKWAFLQKVVAGRRTYLNRGNVKSSLVDGGWFAETRNWGQPFSNDGFQLIAFEGQWGEGEGFASCMGYLRFSTRVPRTAGFKQRVSGAYCIHRAEEISVEELIAMLASFRY